MTTEEVKHIKGLPNQGCGYQKTATLTGISVNTVKAFCNRHNNDRPIIDPMQTHCRECGHPINCVLFHSDDMLTFKFYNSTEVPI